jgi:hypothetical protein
VLRASDRCGVLVNGITLAREDCVVCVVRRVSNVQGNISLIHPHRLLLSSPMPVNLAIRDTSISSFRKYVKDIGRAYQKRSLAMIQLCRLFLEISPGNPDQIDALRR